MIKNSVMLMLVTVANSGLGYVFWVVASHNYAASDIGAATAVISAMNLTALLSDLGFRTLVIHRLPRATSDAQWSRHLSAALIVGLITSIVGGAVAGLVVAQTSDAVRDYLHGAWPVVAVLLTSATTLSWLLDSAAIAERQAKRMLLRNVSNMLLKVVLLIALVALIAASSQSIMLASAVAMAVTVLYGVAVQTRSIRPGWRLTSNGLLPELSAAVRDLAGHHLLNIAGNLPMLIIPLEIVHVLGAKQTAYMSLTWMLGSVFFLISPAVSSTLFAHGSGDVQQLGALVRRSVLIIAALLAPAMAAAIVFGHFVLGFFGSDYAREGYPLLVVLAVSAIPDAVTNIRIGKLRALGDVWTGARLNGAMAVIAVVSTYLLITPLGIVGAGYAWLIAQSCGVLYMVATARRRRYVAQHAIAAVPASAANRRAGAPRGRRSRAS